MRERGSPRFTSSRASRSSEIARGVDEGGGDGHGRRIGDGASPVMVGLVPTIHVFAMAARAIPDGGRPSATSQDVDARHKAEHDGVRVNRDAILLPDGRRWRGAPDEGLRSPQKARRHCCASTIGGGPSPLPLSLISGLPEISTSSVEVGNSRLRCGRGVPRTPPHRASRSFEIARGVDEGRRDGHGGRIGDGASSVMVGLVPTIHVFAMAE